MNKTRPEDDLLVCCARTEIDRRVDGEIRGLLREDLDWKYLIEAAANHGVKPLLCHNLSSHYAGSISTSVLGQLQRYFQAHALNNLFLSRELIRLLALLEKNGIAAIPWKGPVLGAVAYQNIALRQFGDLDILVRAQDATRSKDLLLGAGYRPFYDDESAKDAEAFHALRQVYELLREDGRAMVELHWSITSRTFYFPLDPASLWDQVETISLEGAPVRNLGPEALLLVLCVHGAKHHWGRLMWICDVAELLRTCSTRIDWRRLVDHARQLGGVRMLLLGLVLARDLLEAKLPPDVLRRIEGDPQVKFLAAEVESRLFDGAPSMAVDRPAFYVRLRERASDRWRCRLYLLYRSLSPDARRRALRLLHSGRSWLGFSDSTSS